MAEEVSHFPLDKYKRAVFPDDVSHLGLDDAIGVVVLAALVAVFGAHRFVGRWQGENFVLDTVVKNQKWNVCGMSPQDEKLSSPSRPVPPCYADIRAASFTAKNTRLPWRLTATVGPVKRKRCI